MSLTVILIQHARLAAGGPELHLLVLYAWSDTSLLFLGGTESYHPFGSDSFTMLEITINYLH